MPPTMMASLNASPTPPWAVSHLRVWDGEGDQLGAEGVSVHKTLLQERAAGVDILNLLGRNVLALRQLEDVLLPIDDL